MTIPPTPSPPPIILWLPPAGRRRINIQDEACCTPRTVWCGVVRCAVFFMLWVIQTMWPHFRKWYTRAQSVNTAFVRLIWRSAIESKPVYICGFKRALHIACGVKGNGLVKVLSGSPWGKRWRRATCMQHSYEAMSVTVSLRSLLPPPAAPPSQSLLHSLPLNGVVCETMPAAVSAYKWFSMCFVSVPEWGRGRGR